MERNILDFSKLDVTLKVGLVLATFSWLSYVFYDFNIGLFSRHTNVPLIVEDIPAVWGLGFRMVAATVAVLVVIFFIVFKEFSKSEARTAVRFALLFEGFYFLGFFGGAINVWKRGFFTLPRIFEEVIPTWVDALLLSIILAKLFFELNPNKERKSQIKWILIYITSFIFAFWLNNAGAWIGTVISKGVGYLTQYPVNLTSFLVTVVGLFALFLLAADFTSKWSKNGLWPNLNLRKISAIVTFLGLYPLFIFLLWLFYGSVGGWGVWYAWFLGHGYMSFIALPITFVTIPLLFNARSQNSDDSKQAPIKINQNFMNTIIFLTQVIGVIFFTVFTLAYYIPFPTRNFLIGTQPYLEIMQVFGTLYLVAAIALTIISFQITVIKRSSR